MGIYCWWLVGRLPVKIHELWVLTGVWQEPRCGWHIDLQVFFQTIKKLLLFKLFNNLCNLQRQYGRPIATGNWGCGAFGGDPHLKSMLQWMAASYAGCPGLLYYTFQHPHMDKVSLNLKLTVFLFLTNSLLSIRVLSIICLNSL